MHQPFNRRSFIVHAAAGTAAGFASAARATVRPGGAATGDQPNKPLAAGQFASLIEAERQTVRRGMAEGEFGAAAICMVERGEPVWMEGFGKTTSEGGRSVAPDTIFSVQSTSKNFTAVAILLAVQQGRLDLDAPIIRYSPDFTVRSRFEDHPEKQLTLRLLLSHRAGFTHEAPVGNNYEAHSPSFEAHVRSIEDTWLRFPVGDRYRYSNLGYDLAGFILERATGVRYADWLKEQVFDPLGMQDSTADPAVYSQIENRAIGIQGGHARVPLVTPLVASGGVYTSARDMIAYLQFLLGRGAWRGRSLLAPELWEEMHGFSFGGDYSLGVIREERRYGNTPVRVMSHRGGGFGFGCNFFYCPASGTGWAALFNRPALPGYQFGNAFADSLLSARLGERRPRLPAEALAAIQPLASDARALAGNYIGRNVRAAITEREGALAYRVEGTSADRRLVMTAPDSLYTEGENGEVTTYRLTRATAAMPAHLECSDGEASLDYNEGPDDPHGPDRPEWTSYAGRYNVSQWGRPSIDVAVEVRRGYLYLNGIRLVAETEPGLFFTCDGEAVDFRTSPPTWRNLLLRRV